MRAARVALVVLLLWIGASCAATRWHPPQDQLSVTIAPGLFGWIRADHKSIKTGRWVRDMTIIVYVAGPNRLAGSTCSVQINDTPPLVFAPNPSHTWTVTGTFVEGDHEITVIVGDIVRKHAIHVWVSRASDEVG